MRCDLSGEWWWWRRDVGAAEIEEEDSLDGVSGTDDLICTTFTVAAAAAPETPEPGAALRVNPAERAGEEAEEAAGVAEGVEVEEAGAEAQAR